MLLCVAVEVRIDEFGVRSRIWRAQDSPWICAVQRNLSNGAPGSASSAVTVTVDGLGKFGGGLGGSGEVIERVH